MLSVFPEILFLSPLAPLLLRASLGALFALAAWKHAQYPGIASRALGTIELALAIALVAGAWTQPAAILGSAVILVWLFRKESRVYEASAIMLALAISLSLVVTGPGAFAFDLPL